MSESAVKPTNKERSAEALEKLKRFLDTVGTKGNYRRFAIIVEEVDGVLIRNVTELRASGQ